MQRLSVLLLVYQNATFFYLIALTGKYSRLCACI